MGNDWVLGILYVLLPTCIISCTNPIHLENIQVVPQPKTLEVMSSHPFRMGLAAIVLADKPAMQSAHIAGQIKKELVGRFNVATVMLHASDDLAGYDFYLVVGIPEHFKLLSDLCRESNEDVSAAQPGREGFLVRTSTLKEKPACLIAGSDGFGIVRGGYMFMQLPQIIDGEACCPQIRIIDSPTLTWRGPASFMQEQFLYSQPKESPALTCYDESLLNLISRCGYSAIRDDWPFMGGVKGDNGAFMINEAHRRGLKVCIAFSLETGKDNYVDTSDEQQMARYRRQCEDVIIAGADMLEIAFGDFAGAIYEGEKGRFKDKYDKGLYLCEEAAKIAHKHGIPFQIDSPFYYVVGSSPGAIAFEQKVAQSPVLKDSYYIHTLTGGFDPAKPYGALNGLKTLKETGLKPVYWFNGIRNAVGPTGGWSAYFSGVPRYGVPTMIDFPSHWFESPYHKGFPYFEQTYFNPKPEELVDAPKYIDASWLLSKGAFNWMLHAAWAWGPERFDELRDRQLIFRRLFGLGAGPLVEQWQKTYITALVAIFPEVDPNTIDPHRASENWYDQGFRVYRTKEGSKIQTEEAREQVKYLIAEMNRLRMEIMRCGVPAELLETVDHQTDIVKMAQTESLLLKVAEQLQLSKSVIRK